MAGSDISDTGDPPPYHLFYTAAQAEAVADNSNDGFPKITIRANDAIIAVMGMTGSGKSTFIRHFCKTAVVGHSLHSETATVEVHVADSQIERRRVIFIDTPGFDDDRRPDTVILREIADWLGNTYIKNIKLTGIVYLHGIQATRMGGAATTNLRLFRKLCGKDSMASVVLATSQWSQEGDPDFQAQVKREKELISDDEFWAEMIRQKAHVERQDQEMVSAVRIVTYLLHQRQGDGLDLKIQKEMASGMSLEKTEAGLELEQRLDDLRAAHDREMAALRRDLEEARRDNDERTRLEIEQACAKLQERIDAESAGRERLRVDLETLRRQRKEELRLETEKLEAQWRTRVDELDQDISRMQARADASDEQLRRKIQLAKEKRNEEKRRRRRAEAKLKNGQSCQIM